MIESQIIDVINILFSSRPYIIKLKIFFKLLIKIINNFLHDTIH